MHRLHASRRAARAAPPAEPLGSLRGIWGRPYLDLTRYVDTSRFAAIDEEICLALAELPTSYTGGSHKWMGIVPPSLEGEPYVDYGQVIERMSPEEFARFVSLSDDPESFDLGEQSTYEFGEERPHGLNKRQMRWLEYRYGVYFPWKVFYELIPTRGWDDKSTGRGKSFTEEAEAHFPRLIDFVKSLPFAEIGRCNIMGLAANDHGTVHHDRSSDDKVSVDHFITFCPRGDKELFLWDEEEKRKVTVTPKVYWFNDGDYHGVESAPFFRYSVRVDGFFRPELVARLRRDFT
ncbi:Hypothetical protein A7982_10193 [Minicystis rosea]|nr:Hypothetical protein A7982_10193 [Minicystis rosea]